MNHSSLNNSLAYGWGSLTGLYGLIVNLTLNGVIMLLISGLLLPAASKVLIRLIDDFFDRRRDARRRLAEVQASAPGPEERKDD